MQNKLKTCLLVLLVPALLLGCKKAEVVPTAGTVGGYESSDTTFTSLKTLRLFLFTQADNPGLTVDSVASIQGADIFVLLPKGIDTTALVASYEVLGKTLKVGNREQVSGQTANDFSGPVSYQVTSYDGRTQNYKINISYYSGAAPSGNGITLNGGASSTRSRHVSLLLSGTDVDGIVAYYVSESKTAPAVEANNWVAVSGVASLTKIIPFTLSNSDGTKTVYVWYKNTTGKVSAVVSDTISLSRIYSISIAAGAASTSSKSVTLTLSAATDGITGYYVSETSTAPSSVSAKGWVTVSGAGSTYSNSHVSFTLSNSDGTKTVYVWFQDSTGSIGGGVSDTISLVLPKAITAFSFKAATNAALSIDVKGYIFGGKIGVSLPKGTSLTGLIPTFTTTGASADVNKLTQTSGTTAQSFSSTVTYVAKDVDGGSTLYAVTAVAQVPVPDTGQTTGYTPTFGEDNDYSMNTQSYTVGSGSTAGTVTDKVTGLIWQQCSSGLSGATCATGWLMPYNWADAGTHCSGLSLGGSNAWRLPTVTELSWISQLEGTAPFINVTAFPTVSNSYFWASTVYAADTLMAWTVTYRSSSGGGVSMSKLLTYEVRCVR